MGILRRHATGQGKKAELLPSSSGAPVSRLSLGIDVRRGFGRYLSWEAGVFYRPGMSPTEATEPQSWETVTPGTMGCQVGKGKEVNSGCEEMPKVPSLCGEEVGLALQ